MNSYSNKWALALLLVLSGCRVGPHYEPPTPEVPETWKAKQTMHEDKEPKADLYPWWEVFNDPLLNQLELEAIEQSPTLYRAIETLIMAQSEALAVKSYLYPHITAEPMASQVQMLTQLFLPPGFPTANQIQDVFRIRQTILKLPLVFDYEVDLWGRLRSEYDSAVHQAESKAEALREAMLSLTSEIAAHYFQMRAYDTELEQIDKLIEINKRSLKINETRYNGGLSPLLDVSQARGVLAHAQSDFEAALRLRNLEENQIATLVGAYASEFCLAREPLKEAPPQVPPNLPSVVLLQRPDLAEIERLRAANNDEVRVAYAAFFPKLSLTSAMGYESPELSKLLTWPARLFSMAANVWQPIFEGGLLSANLRTAIAQYQQTDAIYFEKVLTVLQEVEDTLQSIKQDNEQSIYLKEAVEAADLSLKLSQQLFDNGLTNYLQVAVIAQNTLQEHIALTRNLGARYVSTVRLIQSLGGSWNHSQTGTDAIEGEEEGAGDSTCLGS